MTDDLLTEYRPEQEVARRQRSGPDDLLVRSDELDLTPDENQEEQSPREPELSDAEADRLIERERRSLGLSEEEFERSEDELASEREAREAEERKARAREEAKDLFDDEVEDPDAELDDDEEDEP